MGVVNRILNLYGRIVRKIVKIRVHKSVNGRGNRIIIDRTLTGGVLKIVINGNGNEIVVGKNCWFGGNNRFYVVGDNNVIHIGDNVTFDEKVDFVVGEGTKCIIGDDCMLAARVLFRTTDQHKIFDGNNIRINNAGNIELGAHVWLGARVTVMKNVMIGADSMVGYGSLVTRNIPEKCMAVGAPAKVIKEDIVWNR